MTGFKYIAFDADDTLWHTETQYISAQEKFKELLESYHSRDWIDQRLYETEMRNLEFYGYGIKSFMLSMIETAIELSEGRISGHEVMQILDFGRAMMATPVNLFNDVRQVLKDLAKRHTLILITKGDLIDQSSKLVRSGLESCFSYVEIVIEKEVETYRAIMAKYGIDPKNFLMVGNSLRSDVLPVLEAGGQAVYIPYEITWMHEEIHEDDLKGYAFHQLDSLDQLPSLLLQIAGE